VSSNQKDAFTSNARPAAGKKPKLILVTTVALTLRSFFQGQITYLKNKGFEVIGVSSGGPDLEEFARREQLSVYAITMTRGISPFADLMAAVRLWMLFLKIRPVIVHGSTPKAGVLSMLAATLARVPVKIYTLHGVMTEIRRGPARSLLKLMEWIACALADQVFAVSRSVMGIVVSQRLCPQGKIKVLEHGSCNGIDAVNRFNPANLDENKKQALRSQICLDENIIVIGFVGRLVKDKGVVELATAWKRIRNAYTHSRLLTIGPAEQHNPVPNDILEQLDGDDRVTMLDFVANDEMPNYYGIMNIVVIPSYREGFPYVVLEASAMGLPIVATRVTGCTDAVMDGVTGTLVPPRDIEAMVEAISLYIEDPGLRLKHGQEGRELVLAHFKPEPIWDALYAEYVLHMCRKGLSFPPVSKPKSKTSSLLPEEGHVS
jgi:glycosyltransferase involved in cell wall biosynthesis